MIEALATLAICIFVVVGWLVDNVAPVLGVLFGFACLHGVIQDAGRQ